jgi:hypothetical protein
MMGKVAEKGISCGEARLFQGKGSELRPKPAGPVKFVWEQQHDASVRHRDRQEVFPSNQDYSLACLFSSLGSH